HVRRLEGALARLVDALGKRAGEGVGERRAAEGGVVVEAHVELFEPVAAEAEVAVELDELERLALALVRRQDGDRRQEIGSLGTLLGGAVGLARLLFGGAAGLAGWIGGLNLCRGGDREDHGQRDGGGEEAR